MSAPASRATSTIRRARAGSPLWLTPTSAITTVASDRARSKSADSRYMRLSAVKREVFRVQRRAERQSLVRHLELAQVVVNRAVMNATIGVERGQRAAKARLEAQQAVGVPRRHAPAEMVDAVSGAFGPQGGVVQQQIVGPQ